jgi:putative alpha-1,2-mannosidase
VFKKTTIRLENGKKFIITANGNSDENVYMHHAQLNGKPYSKTYITYQDITAGGTLSFDMKSTADKQIKLQPEDLPYSVSK